MSAFRRYRIETRPAPDLAPHPSRFRVHVRRHRLIGLLLKELIEYRANLPVVLSRPCVYGVFSGPVGGLAPRHERCVGCLRCTTQYPDIVQIHPNPARERTGTGVLDPDQVDTILYEARTGRVPVRGAGYRGRFAGEGWDGMWTDMSEIVRPTRDGIHGREFISTVTEVGEKPSYLNFDGSGRLTGAAPRVRTIQVPFLFDVPPRSLRAAPFLKALAEAARRVETLAVVPAAFAADGIEGPHVVPLVGPADGPVLERIGWDPPMLLLDGWDPDRYADLSRRYPAAILGVRLPADERASAAIAHGVRVVHVTANDAARAGSRPFGEAILDLHRHLVDRGIREEVTLIGSGGILTAEHVPKAILCGLDAVGLSTALCVALQGVFESHSRDPESVPVSLPHFEPEWATQRIVNLSASWRDQLLEILGAMGLREVRRLRGEVGRCMFAADLEREAFAGIEGYVG
jgi:glutamate synthase-like protein